MRDLISYWFMKVSHILVFLNQILFVPTGRFSVASEHVPNPYK